MSNRRIIVVDIGNTSTSIALAVGGRIARFHHAPSDWAVENAVSTLIRRVAARSRIDGSVLCSVVPAFNGVWLKELRKVSGRRPIVVSHKLNLDVKISYPKPGAIGADRLANACAAANRYGAPAIVADFGTALTFDIVTADNAYVGGVIAPGLPLMTDYLAEKTALLPRIDLTGPCGKVGKSTAEAMRIGARIGYRGMAREITIYLRDGLNMPDAKLCATGGYAKWALRGIDLPYRIDRHLTLHGLTRIYDINAPIEKRRRL